MATNKYISFNIAGNGGGGGTGGTMNIVELTKAQYEALTTKDPDALYVITDADVIDLNDYALASALTAAETAIATKADKANVTANTGSKYFPKWNSQGIITGTDGGPYSMPSVYMNGSKRGEMLMLSIGTISDTTFYAPTTAGSAGQPLLSNGSGAPVWGGYKFAFITQTAYDALTTPDATTIYFIIGD